MEPKLAQLAAELPRIRLVQQHPALGQQVNVESSRLFVILIKRVEPVVDLWFEFYLSSIHNTDVIRCASAAQHTRLLRAPAAFQGTGQQLSPAQERRSSRLPGGSRLRGAGDGGNAYPSVSHYRGESLYHRRLRRPVRSRTRRRRPVATQAKVRRYGNSSRRTGDRLPRRPGGDREQ